MIFRRMVFSCNLTTSRSSIFRNSDIRKAPSPAGRRQFSLLNANTVRYSPPSSRQAYHFAQRLHPALMPGHARHEALFRPSPVAIHDDGDMTRDRRSVGGGAGGG